MVAYLHSALAEVEAKKSEIVRLTLLLPEADRAKSPAANQWSAAQVVDHLVMFEEYLLAGRKKAIDAGNSLMPGFKSKIVLGMIGFLVRLHQLRCLH